MQAVHVCNGTVVRLTVFSREVSRNAEFRRSMKTDLPMLISLRHLAVPGFLGAGEADGRLLFWTEACQSTTINSPVSVRPDLTTEDIIEIGWQVCSALQQAHNLGLSHGGICPESIVLSHDLRVHVVDFGVSRWLNALRTQPEDADTTVVVSSLKNLNNWRREVREDLLSLASVLQSIVQQQFRQTEAMPPENSPSVHPLQPSKLDSFGADRLDDQFSPATSTDAKPLPSRSSVQPGGIPAQSLQRLLARVCQLLQSNSILSARDFQGRLGELLIGDEDDTIDLVDQRGQSYRSSRSIVDELFDDERHVGENPAKELPQKAGAASTQWHKLLVGVSVVVAAILLVLAALFL